jgi:methanogenic corrinoid protein MtbC1
VERLILLRRAIELGHSIGTIAHLTSPQLKALLAKATGDLPSAAPDKAKHARSESVNSRKLVDEALRKVAAMDVGGLEAVFDNALIVFGKMGLITQLIGPLLSEIGARWRSGELQIAHEHLASEAIRSYLGSTFRQFAIHPSAPLIVITTPAGQLHDLGIWIAGAAASNMGWRVTIAGASLPAEEVVRIAQVQEAKAVALSIIHPGNDPGVDSELRRLRRMLPASIPIIVGGCAAVSYRETIDAIGARLVESFNDFTEALEEFRQGRN